LDVGSLRHDFDLCGRCSRGSSKAIALMPFRDVQNIDEETSKHWKRWLGAENRCVVPFTSFSEFKKAEGGDVWIAFDDSRPLAVFAGI
jgi:putative SOS response-associated peptidase YedK